MEKEREKAEKKNYGIVRQQEAEISPLRKKEAKDKIHGLLSIKETH